MKTEEKVLRGQNRAYFRKDLARNPYRLLLPTADSTARNRADTELRNEDFPACSAHNRLALAGNQPGQDRAH